jgi:hypothetical protein
MWILQGGLETAVEPAPELSWEGKYELPLPGCCCCFMDNFFEAVRKYLFAVTDQFESPVTSTE